MASWATACRLSARLARPTRTSHVTLRGLRTSAAARAAHNFTMPALSPTMTEGNIAAWRVKEGDKFSAGDVLLEIETDKATMDVDAQEDGILMKIMQNDGAKGVQVGTRIAVLAEEGDDVSALEMPPDESSAGPRKTSSVLHQVKPAEADPPVPEQQRIPSSRPAPAKSGGKTALQTKPLLPSVAHLLGENGLDASAVEEMTPTGPNGRLLKGDVLVYLGKIKASTPADVSERFQKNSHLNLENIKLAVRKEVSQGVDAVDHAVELADDELPRPAAAVPSADELFDQVLGLGQVGGTKVSRGRYQPQASAAVPPTSGFAPHPTQRPAQSKRADIIDILIGSPR